MVVFLALFAMNQARGIAVIQMTASSSPILEQIYIYSGAAAILHVPVGTVASRLHRARASLRRTLRLDGEGFGRARENAKAL